MIANINNEMIKSSFETSFFKNIFIEKINEFLNASK